MSTGIVPRLERELGDPFDPENPFSFVQAVTTDENGALPAGIGEVLGARNFLTDLVPNSFGGRLNGVDDLARSVRSLFRRDPCVAVSWGVAPLAAAAQVWEFGTPSQQSEVAAGLLAGDPLEGNVLGDAVSYRGQELHGQTRFVRATSNASRVVLRGRADDGRWRTVLLDRAALPPGTAGLARQPTSGLRGCAFEGLGFSGGAIPATSVLPGGSPAGPEALASAVRAAGSLGVLETALYIVCDFATGRRLYGQAVSDIPHARGMLAGAFADLLIADCLVTSLTRELDAGPAAPPQRRRSRSSSRTRSCVRWRRCQSCSARGSTSVKALVRCSASSTATSPCCGCCGPGRVHRSSVRPSQHCRENVRTRRTSALPMTTLLGGDLATTRFSAHFEATT